MVEIWQSILSRVVLLVKYMLHTLQLAMGWTYRGSNHSEIEIIRTRSIDPDSYAVSYSTCPKLLSVG